MSWIGRTLTLVSEVSLRRKRTQEKWFFTVKLSSPKRSVDAEAQNCRRTGLRKDSEKSQRLLAGRSRGYRPVSRSTELSTESSLPTYTPTQNTLAFKLGCRWQKAKQPSVWLLVVGFIIVFSWIKSKSIPAVFWKSLTTQSLNTKRHWFLHF